MTVTNLSLGSDEIFSSGWIFVDDVFSYAESEINFRENIDMHENLTLDGGISYFNALYPNAGNGTGAVGAGSLKWLVMYCVTLYEGDHVFSEKFCPLCDKEFKEGEAIINYVLSNTEEGTRTIPAHLNCSIKSENQTKAKHDLVIQKLKDTKKYIDPMEEIIRMKKFKEFEDKLKLNKEVKMEKITLKDGKKGLLVSKGNKFRAFSEEQLIELEKRYLSKLAEIQKYIQELNK